WCGKDFERSDVAGAAAPIVSAPVREVLGDPVTRAVPDSIRTSVRASATPGGGSSTATKRTTDPLTET
ncbi:MAG: DZANK-type protein, partial [Chloroflexi bacterium]|nr:DZANK-type protein [Chloroflexota bacterium]